LGRKPVDVAIIGLGFVGLPLAMHFADQGHTVLGIDKDKEKIEHLRTGKSYIPDVTAETIQHQISEGSFQAGLPSETIADASYIVVTVPTPMDEENKEPDLRALISASKFIANHLRQGQTVIFESSTYPGTLEEVILPILSQSGLQVGKDFFLGYSPERIDPGNQQFSIKQIPKVVSGQTLACRDKVIELYSSVFEKIVPVSSPKVAEMCKLFENIQRLVNISLVNEMHLLCLKMGIDFYEALQAAATKPFGFTLYTPGPGIGGHCIPVDPLYFQWKAGQYGLSSRMIEAAHGINQEMPQTIVSRLAEAVDRSKNNKGEQPIKLLVLGITYKKDVNDIRESPALEIFKLLLSKGYQVDYHDPLVSEVTIENEVIRSQPLSKEILEQADAVVITTDHSSLDWDFIGQHAQLIMDTRGIYPQSHEKVVR